MSSTEMLMYFKLDWWKHFRVFVNVLVRPYDEMLHGKSITEKKGFFTQLHKKQLKKP